VRRRLLQILPLLVVLGLAVGGARLWRARPWRVVASVNGTTLQAYELAERAAALKGDARRAVKLWIVKQVFLAEALARGIALTAEDLRESRARSAARLQALGMTEETLEQTCPIPPARRPRDAREGALVNSLLAREVGDRIVVTAADVDARMAACARAGQKPSSRRAAEDALRAQRYAEGFRACFETLFRKVEVRSDDYPAFETLAGFAPTPSAAATEETK